ncbi:MAG TPA: hypothetical protein VE463_12455, partial [Blastococcus sp.]|nr:hypothetical protein [Blastococcus sp.]
MSQGALEQGVGIGGFGDQGTAVVEHGQCPRPSGALGERGQRLHPPGCLFPVAGAKGGLDAVEGGKAADGAQPDAAEVVQRGAGVTVVGGAGALRPAREVVHRVRQDPERLLGRSVEVGEALVVLGGRSALEGSEQEEPAAWGRGQLPLSDAGAQRERLLGSGAQHGPLAGDELGEAEPGQRVQDVHGGAGVSGAGDHLREAAVMGFVVSQVQGRVAEVGQQIEVTDVGAGVQRVSQGRQAARPVLGGYLGEGEKQVAEAAGPGRVAGGGESGGVEGAAAVGAVSAQQRCGDGHLERAIGVVRPHGAGSGGEDAVRVAGGTDVDLDAASEPVDVGAQQSVVGELARRCDQAAGLRGLPGSPRVAGGHVQACGPGLLAGGQLGGALVGSGCRG